MGIFDRFRAAEKPPPPPSLYENRNLADDIQAILNEGNHGFGVLPPVNPSRASAISTVYAADALISGAIAATPLCVYQGRDRDRRRLTDSPLCSLLNRKANQLHTAYDVISFLVSSVLLHGNGYAQLQRNISTDEVIGIFPLLPTAVKPMLTDEGLIYRIETKPAGFKTLPQREMLHIRRLSPLDVLLGKSPITTVAGAFASSQAVERHAQTFFANGARPLVIIEPPASLDEQQRDELRKDWGKRHGGSKAHSTGVVFPGTKIHTVSIDPDSLQLLESRKFSREQVAEVFNVPPQLLGIPGNSVSSTEQAALQFNKYTLRPWMACIEASLTASILDDDEDLEIRFDRADLQVMDVDATAKLISVTKQNAVSTTNEWRLRLGQEASTDANADKLFHQLNLTPLDVMTAPQGPGAPILRAQEVIPEEAAAEDEIRTVSDEAFELEDVSRGAIGEFRAIGLELLVLERDMVSAASGVQTSDPALLDVMKATARPAVIRALRPLFETHAHRVVAALPREQGDEVAARFLPNFTESAVRRWLDLSGGFGLEEEGRADSFSLRETRQLTYALAREIWRDAGVARLEWSAAGESEQDQGLDGQIIDLQADEKFRTSDDRQFRNPPIGRASFGVIGPVAENS